jgi:hypothetical protein
MKKLILAITMILLVSVPSFATDYYGGAAGKNLNADDLWYEAVSGSCTGSGSAVASSTVLQAGNNLFANGCTIAITDSFTATKISTENGGAANAVAGGSFTLTTASVTGKTLTANIVAGDSACLTLTGNGAGTPVLTIIGNLTGGTGSADYAVTTNHSVGTLNIGSSGTPSTITGGGNVSAYGFYNTAMGPITAYASIVGATSVGWSNNGNATVSITGSATGVGNVNGYHNSSTGATTMTGNCTGSSTGYGMGCYAASTGAITVVGNIVNGTRGVGAGGTIIWTPTAPANGATGHYVKFDGGGTAVFAGKNTDDATKALTTFYYIDPTDGTSDQGSATGTGGGGAWLF